MAIRTDFTAGEVLAAADLNDTFGAKLNLAGGKILQVVRDTDTTERTTTSTSLVDVTGMSVTITPQKSDSAIILVACYLGDTASGNNSLLTAITDNSNNALSGAQSAELYDAGDRTINNHTLFAYSTPATISATTYKLRFASGTGNTVRIRNQQTSGQLYAIEVSA